MVEESLRALLESLPSDDVSLLSRCFCRAEQVLGSPEEHPTAFAKLLVQLYSIERSAEEAEPLR